MIWFDIAGRRITDGELADLVSKGKTRKRKWRSSEGAEIGGRLVLDLSAAREVGAARLDAGGFGRDAGAAFVVRVAIAPDARTTPAPPRIAVTTSLT